MGSLCANGLSYIHYFPTREALTVRSSNPWLHYGQIASFLVIGVLVAVEMFTSSTYVAFEATSGTVNTWTDQYFQKGLPLEPVVDNSKAFCNNPTYDVNPSTITSFSSTNLSCACYHPAQSVFILNGGASVNGLTFTSSLIEETGVFNSCFDNLTFSFQFSVTTSFETKSLPALDILDSNDQIVASLPSGNFVSDIGFEQLLEWAGTSLEERVFGGPHIRLTGAVLTVEIDCSNYRTFSTSSQVSCQARVRHSEGLWGFIGYDMVRDDNGTPVDAIGTNGVQVNFKFAGSIGKFSPFNFLLSLVSGAALITWADLTVRFIAQKYIPGMRDITSRYVYLNEDGTREEFKSKQELAARWRLVATEPVKDANSQDSTSEFKGKATQQPRLAAEAKDSAGSGLTGQTDSATARPAASVSPDSVELSSV